MDLMDAILDGVQVPHQPLLIITDSAVFSGLPVFREALRRALNRSVRTNKASEDTY